MTEQIRHLIQLAGDWAFAHQFASGLVVGIFAGMLLERIHVILARSEGEE